MLYNNLSGYFREKYGKRVKKICIDGGFTCPNRDGRCGTGGCIFCGERGAGEHIEEKTSIVAQVKAALVSARKGDIFTAYFQNFTNTYAEPSVLKQRYDAALCDERIKALAIGTRPDCIDEEKASLIESYKERCDVWVELGLQTASDRTAELINRGYGREKFKEAMEILSRHGIPVVVHLIIGLPGESDAECKETVEYLSGFDVWGVKIHSLYVMRGTRLGEMYLSGEYTPPTEDEYIRRCVYMITHLSPSIIIHRLTGDCPDGLLLAPRWNTDKHALIEKIQNALKADGLKQGIYFNHH